MKLKYGVFLDTRISMGDDWDSMPIGAHAAIRRMQRENAKTAGREFYYKANGICYIVEKPTVAEAILAMTTGALSKKVVGYRDSSTHVKDTKELHEKLEQYKKKREASKGM